MWGEFQSELALWAGSIWERLSHLSWERFLQDLVMRQEVLPEREVKETTPSGPQIWTIT